MVPFSIFLISNVAILAVWIARQKVSDDAIRQLWQQLASLWKGNPELHELIASGRPIDPDALANADAETRADVSTALDLCDALGGLAMRFGADRSTLFSLWPIDRMWASLRPVVERERATNPIAYARFERAVAVHERYSGRLAAEARGESNVLLVTIAVGIAVFIYALDQTIVASALPTIVSQLQGISLYGWVFSAYTIAATAMTLLYGRLADLTSRRTLFIIAMSGFLFGSILCGFAPNMPLLVGFRAIQGLFGGATFPLAIGIIADTYPIERRAQGFAIVPTTFAIASVTGPLAGGFLAQSVGWRWIFFVNIPVVLSAISLLLYTYKARPQQGHFRLRDLDYPGIVLLFGGLVTLLIALTTGGNDWDWASWEEVVMLVAGATMLVLFGYVELHTTSRRPLLPLRILKHRGLGGALLTVSLLAWVTTSLILFMPEYAQAGLMADAQGAGLILIPLMLTWATTANIAVRFGQRRGFRNVALVGVPPIILGLIYIYFMHYGFDAWTVAPGLALVGLGAGMINPNMLVLAQSSLSDRDQGLAGGLGNVAMSLSAAIAAASLSAFQTWRLEGYAQLSSVTNASQLLSPFGRFWLAGIFGQIWVGHLQRWLTLSIHDVFVVALIPAAGLGLWLWLRVPSNALVREIRLPPLGAPPPTGPQPGHGEAAPPQPVPVPSGSPASASAD